MCWMALLGMATAVAFLVSRFLVLASNNDIDELWWDIWNGLILYVVCYIVRSYRNCHNIFLSYMYKPIYIYWWQWRESYGQSFMRSRYIQLRKNWIPEPLKSCACASHFISEAINCCLTEVMFTFCATKLSNWILILLEGISYIFSVKFGLLF